MGPALRLTPEQRNELERRCCWTTTRLDLARRCRVILTVACPFDVFESVPNLSRKFSRLLAEQAAARQQLRTLNGNSSYVTKKYNEPTVG
jgi:hypothetical protein